MNRINEIERYDSNDYYQFGGKCIELAVTNIVCYLELALLNNNIIFMFVVFFSD